jgi:hypothetical protein
MAKPVFDSHVFALIDAEAELAEFKILLNTNTDGGIGCPATS